jgi:hypothetical protein
LLRASFVHGLRRLLLQPQQRGGDGFGGDYGISLSDFALTDTLPSILGLLNIEPEK